MEIGIQKHSLPEILVLARDRLLHLDDHSGLGPHVRRPGLHLSPGIHILLIGEAGTQPGPPLHQHRMPCPDIGADRARGKPNPKFVVLNLLRQSDNHGKTPSFQPEPTGADFLK